MMMKMKKSREGHWAKEAMEMMEGMGNASRVHAIRPHPRTMGKGTFHSKVQMGKITHEPVR